jgi:NADH-quinone oxidoreductase subunit K
MFLTQIITNSIIFIIGSAGLILRSTNMLIVLMCIEMILLSANLNFIVMSIYLDDFTGQIFSLIILTIAAAESAIGLAILILYYRTKKDIVLSNVAVLKG